MVVENSLLKRNGAIRTTWILRIMVLLEKIFGLSLVMPYGCGGNKEITCAQISETN